MFSYLSKAQLQEELGEHLLTRLEEIIPNLSGGEEGPVQMYTSPNLVRIFEAFAGPESLRSRSFRKTVFRSLPNQVLEDLAEATGYGQETADFDERVRQLASVPWTGANREFWDQAVQVFELPHRFVPPEMEARSYHERMERADRLYWPLKDFQNTVLERAREQVSSHYARFVIQMPTGSGKTRTSMQLVAEVLNESAEGAVVWLAHSEELCEQAVQCFKDVWIHIARKEVDLFRCWGSGREIPEAQGGSAFLVSGFQKLRADLENYPERFERWKDEVVLIVVDEAHKAIAPTYNEVIKSLIGRSTRVVGLTATPGRGVDAEEENKKLSEFFFNEIVKIEAPRHETPVSVLQKKGVLAEVRYEELVTGRHFSLSSRQRSHLEREFDFPPGFLKRVGEDDVRNVEIVRRLESLYRSGRQVLLFGCSVSHSKLICALMVYRGCTAAHIDGDTSKERRRHLIQSFKDGEIQVLCNYGVLSTGFDAPKTDVVFITRPTGSIVLFSQMIGRGLRGPAIGGTESCLLINVRDNIEGWADPEFLVDYFDEYWH